MPHRSDVKEWARPPKHVDELLFRLGGKNPYGEANFRCVLGHGVYKQRGGLWHKWREGATLQSRGGMHVNEDGVRIEPSEEKPLSITAEVRWVKTYPSKELEGWIIEEWHPAHAFGTPEEWAAQKVPGTDLAALGPYPERGRYMLSFPFAWKRPDKDHMDDPRFEGHIGLPPDSVLELAVQYVHRCREFWAQLTPANRRRLEEDADLARAALLEKYDDDRKTAMIRDAMSPMLSNSLEAGRWREQLAQAAGVRSHVGN